MNPVTHSPQSPYRRPRPGFADFSRRTVRFSIAVLEGRAPLERDSLRRSARTAVDDLTEYLKVAQWSEAGFYALTGVAGVAVLVVAVAVAAVLAEGAQASFHAFGFGFLWGKIWNPNPSVNVFGVVPFVDDTLITSALALFLAVPLALGSAIFLTTQAPRWMRGPVGTAIELLAAIPSVIYGLWGLYVLHPLMEKTVEPWLQKYLGWSGLFGGHAVGLDILTAGVILAVMIVPTVAAVSRDTIAAVPSAQREAALSLGATDWESTRMALLPYARSGIIGGIILGLGRAMGETMAVVMVIGGRDAVPTSLLSGGQTIASLIANELVSYQTTLQVSAILEAGLVLLLISLLVNVVARLLVWRVLNVSTGTME